MPRISAGIVMYRHGTHGLEVLLVHPGGPFFRDKDLGAWSIPKGEAGPGEDLADAARREFREELGVEVAGELLPLAPVRQKGGKVVHAWAVRGDIDPTAEHCNFVRVQWPPASGRFIRFREIDRAAFFQLDEAERRVNPAQVPLLRELVTRLGPA